MGAYGGLRLSSPPDAVAAWSPARDRRISEAQPRSGGRR